jgi:hypothetical protein
MMRESRTLGMSVRGGKYGTEERVTFAIAADHDTKILNVALHGPHLISVLAVPFPTSYRGRRNIYAILLTT